MKFADLLTIILAEPEETSAGIELYHNVPVCLGCSFLASVSKEDLEEKYYEGFFDKYLDKWVQSITCDEGYIVITFSHFNTF